MFGFGKKTEELDNTPQIVHKNNGDATASVSKMPVGTTNSWCPKCRSTQIMNVEKSEIKNIGGNRGERGFLSGKCSTCSCNMSKIVKADSLR